MPSGEAPEVPAKRARAEEREACPEPGKVAETPAGGGERRHATVVDRYGPRRTAQHLVVDRVVGVGDHVPVEARLDERATGGAEARGERRVVEHAADGGGEVVRAVGDEEVASRRRA